MDKKMDKKRNRKNKMQYVMAVVCFLVLCGCGKGAERETRADMAGMQEGGSYAAEYQPLDKYCESISAVMLGDDGKVYFTGVKENADILFSLTPGGNGVEEYSLELGEGRYVSAIGKDTGGNLLLAVIGCQGDSFADRKVDRVMIQKVSTEGELLGTVDSGNIFLGREVETFYINHVFQDAEGNYYMSAAKEICVLHPDGSLYFDIPVDAYIYTMFVMGDGRIVAGYDGRKGWQLEEVDLLEKSLKPLESSIRFDQGVYRKGTDKELAYTSGTMLYTCDLSEESPDALLNWMDYSISGNNVRDFMLLPDGRIAVVTVDYSAGAAKELCILKKQESSEAPEKKKLTYAALNVSYYAERDIVAFNKQSDEYYIEVKVYGDDSMAYEDRIALLNADLTGSQPPDMIDMAGGGLSLGNFAAAGVAEDLTPYLEGDDTVKREDFPENIIKAYERDGKLYAIMPSFVIGTLVGKVSDVGEKSTWSVEEMAALLDSKEKDVQLLEDADRGTMLWLACRMNQEMFIDWERGTCDFTGGKFEKILEFANRFPEEADVGSGFSSQIEKLRNGKLLLLSGTVASVEEYQLYEYMFGEPVNFIGYPAAGGSGQIIIPWGTTVVMHAASSHQEGVWEFISFCLSEERQEQLKAVNGDGFPARISALDQLLQKEMEEEYDEDGEGNRIRKPKNIWAFGELDINAYAAAPEQVEKLRRIMETAQMDQEMDPKVFEIIYEEAEACFNGTRSAKEAAEVIQNRVQTYLNERS